MAFACAPFPLFGARDRNEYACVGVPPEKEVTPEPRENGAALAALARILRSVFGASEPAAGAGLRSGRPRV